GAATVAPAVVPEALARNPQAGLLDLVTAVLRGQSGRGRLHPWSEGGLGGAPPRARAPAPPPPPRRCSRWTSWSTGRRDASSAASSCAREAPSSLRRGAAGAGASGAWGAGWARVSGA